MAVVGKRVDVTISPTKLNSASSGSTDPTVGSSLLVRAGSVSLFLGASNLTTATGFELLANEAVPIDLGKGEDIYGIVASGTSSVHVLEVGV